MIFLLSFSCLLQVSEGNPGNGAMPDKTRDNYKQCLAHDCVSKCTDIIEPVSFVCISYMERSEIWLKVNWLIFWNNNLTQPASCFLLITEIFLDRLRRQKAKATKTLIFESEVYWPNMSVPNKKGWWGGCCVSYRVGQGDTGAGRDWSSKGLGSVHRFCTCNSFHELLSLNIPWKFSGLELFCILLVWIYFYTKCTSWYALQSSVFVNMLRYQNI